MVVVFTRENRGGSAQHATRATPTRSSHRPMEEEAVFIRGVNTNEDPPNAHQAQHQKKEEVVVVFTHENRGGSAQHATRATPIRSSHGPDESLALCHPYLQPALCDPL